MPLSNDHTFAICAYKQSPYLAECIESVLNQTRGDSEVYIATSTPSDWLDGVARTYGLPVFVNKGERGIGQDWNFAVSQAHTPYVTVTHQDDIYCPGYAEAAVEMLSRAEDSLIFFCDYGELRDGVHVDENRILKVKRRLLKNLRDGAHANDIKVRRRMLSLGSAICCPSVTLNMRNCPTPPYQMAMKCSLDWDTWEHLSRLRGGFYYSSKILMYHRIHRESATTELIGDSTRHSEDLEMLRRFWPEPVARLIERFYSESEKSNG